MFKLYARKGAGSAAIEAMLALCGAPYVVEDVPRLADGSIPPSFYRINPRGEVPVLILPDDSTMTESAAMLIYLGDQFPAAGLAPPLASPPRPRYLRWMLFLATTVYLSDLRMYYPANYTTDPAAAPGIKAKAIAAMVRELAILADAIGRGPFILGETMSAVDIYAAMLASWAPDVPALYASHPNIKVLCERVAAVPAVAQAWARNGM